jgi:hypothetical protein
MPFVHAANRSDGIMSDWLLEGLQDVDIEKAAMGSWICIHSSSASDAANLKKAGASGAVTIQLDNDSSSSSSSSSSSTSLWYRAIRFRSKRSGLQMGGVEFLGSIKPVQKE